LTGANLRGAYLRASNCTRATLQYAQLFGAVLTNTLFSGADLQHIGATSHEFAEVDMTSLNEILIDTHTAQELQLMLPGY
jgi:uncharacterized protein YjbI with pentapeptide repeats